MKLDLEKKLSVIMWGLPFFGGLILSAVLLWGDNRYFTRAEVEKAKQEYFEVREKDLTNIDHRFDRLTVKVESQRDQIGAVREDIAGVKGDLAGIRALLEQQTRLLEKQAKEK